jgi:serine/threonine-protein kinase
MMQVREQPPPLPSSVPRAARELIESVLVKDPKKRYGTGGELALAVGAIRRGEPLPEPASVSGSTPVIPARSPSTPSRARPAVTATMPSPKTKSGQDRKTRSPVKAVRRIKPPRPRPLPTAPAPAPASRTEPLRLQPKARSGRTLLLVLFVLLTMAAVTIGVFVFRGLRDQQIPDPDPLGSSTGTVTSREGVLAGPAVAGWAFEPKILR